MLKKLRRLFDNNRRSYSPVLNTHKIIITSACIDAIQTCIASDAHKEHEGIAYLVGKVIGAKTIALASFCPEAQTTFGSFSVSAIKMARVIRAANRLDLQVVGQVHSHPGYAFHSSGDEAGANIAYEGYISIVLPIYGKRLPSLDGAAFFVFCKDSKFIELSKESVVIVPEVLR